MKNIITLLLLTLSSFAFCQTTVDTTGWRTQLDTSCFVITNDVKKIVNWVMVKFPEWEKMLNPEKKFNENNKGQNSAKRRLFFAAHNGDNWIVSYEHSESSYHTHCFFILVNEKHEIHTLDCHKEFRTFNELRNYALMEAILFEKWDGIDY